MRAGVGARPAGLGADHRRARGRSWTAPRPRCSRRASTCSAPGRGGGVMTAVATHDDRRARGRRRPRRPRRRGRLGHPGHAQPRDLRGPGAAGIRHLSPRHEQGAAFAADGYSRVTGRLGRVRHDLRARRPQRRDGARPGLLGLDPGAARRRRDAAARARPAATASCTRRRTSSVRSTASSAYAHRVTSVAEIPVAVAQAFGADGDRPPAPRRDRDPARPAGRGGHGPGRGRRAAAGPRARARGRRRRRGVPRPRPAPRDPRGRRREHAPRSSCASSPSGSARRSCARSTARARCPRTTRSASGPATRPRAVRELVDASDAVLVVGSELGPSDLWWGPLDLAGKAVRIDVDPAQAVTNAVPVVSVDRRRRAGARRAARRARRRGRLRPRRPATRPGSSAPPRCATRSARRSRDEAAPVDGPAREHDRGARA